MYVHTHTPWWWLYTWHSYTAKMKIVWTILERGKNCLIKSALWTAQICTIAYPLWWIRLVVWVACMVKIIYRTHELGNFIIAFRMYMSHLLKLNWVFRTQRRYAQMVRHLLWKSLFLLGKKCFFSFAFLRTQYSHLPSNIHKRSVFCYNENKRHCYGVLL